LSWHDPVLGRGRDGFVRRVSGVDPASVASIVGFQDEIDADPTAILAALGSFR
jgi:hypothetical protein